MCNWYIYINNSLIHLPLSITNNGLRSMALFHVMSGTEQWTILPWWSMVTEYAKLTEWLELVETIFKLLDSEIA